jgi:hypothetical protein
LEDVKPALDDEAQSVLQSLSASASEEDVRKLNEAIKVNIYLFKSSENISNDQ